MGVVTEDYRGVTRRQCENCAWFHGMQRPDGQCRRNAPGANGFVRVKFVDGCGEFEPSDRFRTPAELELEEAKRNLEFNRRELDRVYFAIAFTEWARAVWGNKT